MTAPADDSRLVVELTAQLDAIRDVLRAISASPFDLDLVLDIVVERMSKLCHADIGIIYLPGQASMIGAGAPASRLGESSEVAPSITTATPTSSQPATTKLPVASRTAPRTTGPTAANV